MNTTQIFGFASIVLIVLGMYSMMVDPQPLRKVLAFNILGGGVFLLFGVVARRGASAGLASDPVPLALIITGIVVAFAATALVIALLLRLFAETGQANSVDGDAPATKSTRPIMADDE